MARTAGPSLAVETEVSEGRMPPFARHTSPLVPHGIVTDGRPGYLTPEQELTLGALRAALADTRMPRGWANDDTLCRFLRARNWALDQTLAMLRATIAWRDDFPYAGGAGALLHFVYDEEKEVRRCFPQAFHKTDKWGRPVLIQCVGGVDAAALAKVTSFDKLLLYFIHRLERTIHVKSVRAEMNRREHTAQCELLMYSARSLSSVGIHRARLSAVHVSGSLCSSSI